MYEKLLLVDWSVFNNFNTVEEAVSKFYQILDEIFQMHVPRKVTYVGNYPNWFNGSIIKIVKQKKSAWKKYSKTKSPDDYLTFKTLRTQLKSKIKDAYKLCNE